MRVAIAIAILATGCIQDETDTGPSVTMSLSAPNGSVTDSDTDAQFDLEGMSSISVTLEVDTQPGESDVDDSSFPVSAFSGSLSIPVTNFTDADFTSDDNDDGPTFTSNDPVTIPASAVGQSILVKLSAHDSRGLSANSISFSIEVVDSGP